MAAVSKKWTIRECRSEEAEAVLRLWAEAGATPSVTDSASALQKAIRESPAHVLVAEIEGQMIGSIIGAFDGWRANIYRLAVHPAFRRQGIARNLVAEVERILRLDGALRITALVEHDHAWAVGFWESVGYERDQRMSRYIQSNK